MSPFHNICRLPLDGIDTCSATLPHLSSATLLHAYSHPYDFRWRNAPLQLVASLYDYFCSNNFNERRLKVTTKAVAPRIDPAMMRSSDREIRLLHLLPGEGDDAIRCTTRVVSLNEHPDFETVSYVWGDRTGEETIDVSGDSIQVTKNLHAGLLRLRHSTTERTLWIDQICINQWDLQEKAAQVALMRDIYKQCTRCVTWMGELSRDGIEVPIRDAEAVFDFLSQVAAVATVPLNGLPILFQDSDEGLAARVAFGHFSMYGNPWWSRIWTVQEAIIPSSGVLVWGPLSISREVVLTAARNLRDLNSLPSLPEGFAACRRAYTELLRRLLYPVHGFNHSKTDSALNLLMRWRHREFTDPRDKVYALLGMISSDAIPSARYCDYTIAVPQLFARVTCDLIRHENSLRPFVGACEMPHSIGDVPSWAINFADCNRIGRRQLKWWGHSHRYRVFSACGDHALKVVSTSDDKTLALEGVYLDEVWDTAELLRIDAHDPVQPEDLQKPLTAVFRLLENYKHSDKYLDSYKDGYSWHSALCRTLVGDLIMDEIPTGRIEFYGRSRLQAKFEELFDEVQINLGEEIYLDYIPCSPATSVYSPTRSVYSPTSPVYSSTSPKSVVGPRSDVSRSPAFSTALSSGSDQSSNESGDDFDSQPSYTSERSVRRWGSGRQTRPLVTRAVSRDVAAVETTNSITPDIHIDHVEEVPAIDERETEPRREHTQGSRPNHHHALSETSEDSRAWSNRQRGRGFFVGLYESLIGMLENQNFFITKSGYVGIGPPQMKSGDQVWIFSGGNVPFVMRKIDDEKEGCAQLVLVGDAYVHGVMDGEAMKDDPRVQTVHIH